MTTDSRSTQQVLNLLFAEVIKRARADGVTIPHPEGTDESEVELSPEERAVVEEIVLLSPVRTLSIALLRRISEGVNEAGEAILNDAALMWLGGEAQGATEALRPQCADDLHFYKRICQALVVELLGGSVFAERREIKIGEVVLALHSKGAALEVSRAS